MAGRADISAGAAFVRIYVKTAEVAHGLITVENMVKGFTKRLPAIGHILAEFTPGNIVRNITAVFTGITTAIAKMMDRVGESLLSIGKKTAMAGAGIGAAMLAAAGHFAHAGDALYVLSQRTGATTQMLSGLGFAARQTGATMDEVETGMRMMQKTIGDAANGSKEAQTALGKLGLTVSDLINKSPDQQFQMIADGLAGVKDQSLRTSAAVDILGRSGQSLLPMMTGLRGFMADAARLGLIVKPEQAQLAEQLVDKFQALKEAVFAGVFAVGEALGPALLDAIKAATDLAIRFRAWVVDNKETVNLVAKIALGLAGAGVAAAAIGVAFKGMAIALGVASTAMSIFGSAVASVAGVLSVIGIVVAIASKLALLATMFPAVAAGIAAVGSAIAGIASGGIMAALSLVGAILSTIFFEIILPAIAIVGAITAAIAVMAAGAAVAAFTFWKVAKPLEALKPVAMTAFDAIKNIGKAFSEGGIQGAANAAIDGLKRVFLAGVSAIMTMIKNSLQNLPGFINGAVSGIGGAVSAITATISRLFTEMWPAIKLAFSAFVAFAGDVFQQLPAIAAYATGRVHRAIFDGITKLVGWMYKTFVNVAETLLKTFVSFGPKLIKAMFTGQLGSLTKEIGIALSVATGYASGAMKGEAPEFKPSAGTVAAWKELSSEIGSIPGAVAKSAGGESAGSPAGKTAAVGGATIVAAMEIPKPDIDPSQLQKYRDRLLELNSALSAGRITAAEWMDGMRQLKRETLGIDPSPVEQFETRVNLLSEAHRHGVVSAKEWVDQFSKMKQEILGLKTDPIDAYHQKMELLYDLFRRGRITKAELNAGAMEAIPDKAKQIFEETRTPLEKYKAALADLEKHQRFLDPETMQRKKEQLKKEFEDSTKTTTGEGMKMTGGPQSYAGYSATAAMSAGASAGSPQERVLKEMQEQKKLQMAHLEEQRKNTAAIQKLADGFRQRR